MIRTLSITFVVALLAASAAEAKVIGKATASGDFVVATASGTAEHPRKLSFQVITSPHQKVSGNWIVTCARGFSAISAKTRTFNGRSPLRRNLPITVRGAESCDVIVAATNDVFGPGGRVTVRIFAT